MKKVICPKCNTEIEEDSKYCIKCGYKLENSEADISCHTAANRKPLITAIIIIGICVGIAICVLVPKLLEIKKQKENYQLANIEYENGNYEDAIQKYSLAGDYADAAERYVITTYEFGKKLLEEWDYSSASKQFKKIDYIDSQELAEFYADFDENRYYDERFYYYAEEFAESLNYLLQQENINYSAKIDDDNITDTPVIYIYDSDSFTGIYISLAQYDESGSFSGIDIRWLNVSEIENNIGVATYIYAISLADRSMALQEANDYYFELLDEATENALWGNIFCNNLRNDISYIFWYGSEDDESGLLICSPSE